MTKGNLKGQTHNLETTQLLSSILHRQKRSLGWMQAA